MKFRLPRRLLCILLTLVMCLSVLPLGAFAVPVPPTFNDKTEVDKIVTEFFEHGQDFLNSFSSYEAAVADFLNNCSMFEGFTSTLYYSEMIKALQAYYGFVPVPFVPHYCWWEPAYTRTSHFLRCPGCEARKEQDVHNHDGENGSCTCGYQFSDNAELVALGLKGLTLDKPFDPAVTEYTATVNAWQNLAETQINAFPFDALTEVEISEDLTIKAGAVYTVKVTANDGTTTHTYTITVAN